MRRLSAVLIGLIVAASAALGVWENGVSSTAGSGGSGSYLPLTGGTLGGNLGVEGDLSITNSAGSALITARRIVHGGSIRLNDENGASAVSIDAAPDGSGSIVVDDNSSVASITIDGDLGIIPSSTSLDLGSPSNPWGSLYVDTNTVHIGSNAVSVSEGQVTVVVGTNANADVVYLVKQEGGSISNGTSKGTFDFENRPTIGTQEVAYVSESQGLATESFVTSQGYLTTGTNTISELNPSLTLAETNAPTTEFTRLQHIDSNDSMLLSHRTYSQTTNTPYATRSGNGVGASLTGNLASGITGDFTVNCWGRVVGSVSYGAAVDVGSSSTGFGCFMTAARTFAWKVEGSSGDFSAAGSLLATWEMLTWRKEGSTIYFYRNAVLKDTDTVATSQSSSLITRIGDGFGGGVGKFGGDLDEICLWNRALSPAEITTLYGDGLGEDSYGDITQAPWNNGLILGLHLDEADGLTADAFQGSDFTYANNNGHVAGYVEIPAALQTADVLEVLEGVDAGEGSIVNLGNDDSRTVLQSKTIRMETGGPEALRITEGDVGIGDTSPDANLEVVGTMYVSSTAGADGDRLSVDGSTVNVASNLTVGGNQIVFNLLPSSTNNLPSGALWSDAGSVKQYIP